MIILIFLLTLGCYYGCERIEFDLTYFVMSLYILYRIFFNKNNKNTHKNIKIHSFQLLSNRFSSLSTPSLNPSFSKFYFNPFSSETEHDNDDEDTGIEVDDNFIIYICLILLLLIPLILLISSDLDYKTCIFYLF